MNDAPSPLTLLPERPAWHALPTTDVVSRLKSAASGLSEEEAAERLRRYGPNTFPEPPHRSLVRILLAQLASPLIYPLLAAALAALVFGEVASTLFIGSVVLLNSAIAAFRNGKPRRTAPRCDPRSKG